jgi:hypothetical protein
MTTAQMTTIKNPTALALVEAMLQTSTDDFDTPLSEIYSPAEVLPESVERIYLEFQRFIEMVEPEIDKVDEREWNSLDEFYLDSRPDNPTELYFIYTRNYEGEGFWNKGKWDESVSNILTRAAHSFPEIVASLDDNGRIYFH